MIAYERAWGNASKRTFTIEPIKKFIRRWSVPGTVYDVFPFTVGEAVARRVDALDGLKAVAPASVATVLYDPVYSHNQAESTYNGSDVDTTVDVNPGYFAAIEIEIFRITRPGSRVLKFGWNSKGMRGFSVIGGMLVAHGSWRNDTICTALERVQCTIAEGRAADEAGGSRQGISWKTSSTETAKRRGPPTKKTKLC